MDQQIHLGFDLASYTGTPVLAANRGRILFADELGIYGNCVIVDHGMGVQTLYAHLSTIGVKEGETLEKGQTLGRTGSTGLAAGDHLHFTMLVNGVAVSPVPIAHIATDASAVASGATTLCPRSASQRSSRNSDA